MFLPLITGLAAGVVHVFSGPDHLSAIAPFAAENKSKGWLTGLFWGIGHTSGVWIIGIIAYFLREILPLESISIWSERLVGFTLVGIGLWGIGRALKTRVHAHEHTHHGEAHVHAHAHTEGAEHTPAEPHRHSHAPLGIGVLHGLAGSGHLFGVMPALLLPSRIAAITYVAAYGLGSILAMSLFSQVISKFSSVFSSNGNALKYLQLVFSSTAILVGLFWINHT